MNNIHISQNEAAMRAMASVWGYPILSFGIDYKQNNEDRHRSVQVTGNGTLSDAVDGILEELRAQNKHPQAIVYFPGDHTKAELDTLIETFPPGTDFQIVYMSDEAIQEAEQMRK